MRQHAGFSFWWYTMITLTFLLLYYRREREMSIKKSGGMPPRRSRCAQACDCPPLRGVQSRSALKKKRPPKGGLSDLLDGFNLTEGLNYLLPFRVAVFVAASHVISVTPRAVARSLIGRNVLPSTTSTEAEAGITEPLTLIAFAPTVIVMIL